MNMSFYLNGALLAILNLTLAMYNHGTENIWGAYFNIFGAGIIAGMYLATGIKQHLDSKKS